MERKRTLLWYALPVAFGVLFSCVSYEEKGRQAEIASRASRDKPAPQASLQPVTVSQCTKIGDVSFLIERGDNSCIQNLTSYENTKCEGTGVAVLADQDFDKNR